MLQCLLLYIEEAIFQWLPERVECCICFCLRFSSFFLSFLGFRGMIFSIVIQQEFRSSVMVLQPKVDQVGSSCISSHSSFFVFYSEASNSKKLSCVLPWSPCTCQMRLLSKLVPRALIARVRGLEG
jgi:hypothetical protein